MGANQWYTARGCAKLTAVVSDANMLKDVTKVLEVQHLSAKLTAVECGASILKVVTRVLKVQHCSA
jgi:hypothetical protein